MLTASDMGNFKIEELLYCPDYAVKNSSIIGVNPSRIVDATGRSILAVMINMCCSQTRFRCRVQESSARFLQTNFLSSLTWRR
jgi:hypothetical protein